MPQADLFLTADQADVPAAEVLAEIERIIRAFDDSAGECKGRAHRVAESHHAHLLLRLALLAKPHRDAAYTEELGQRLAKALAAHATSPCAVNVQITFDLDHYTALKV